MSQVGFVGLFQIMPDYIREIHWAGPLGDRPTFASPCDVALLEGAVKIRVEDNQTPSITTSGKCDVTITVFDTVDLEEGPRSGKFIRIKVTPP